MTAYTVPLTRRQTEVLDLLCEGHGNRAIGQRLDVSEDTVKSHVKAILAAVGAESRTEAVVLVLTGQVRVDGASATAPLEQAGQAEAFTQQEARTARDLWHRLGREPMSLASPEQLLAFMRHCPDEVGLKYAARIIEAQQAQQHCFQADHEGLIEEFWARERQLAEARAKGAAA